MKNVLVFCFVLAHITVQIYNMFPVSALKTDKSPYEVVTRNDQYKQSRGPLKSKYLPPARWTPPVPPTLATSTSGVPSRSGVPSTSGVP